MRFADGDRRLSVTPGVDRPLKSGARSGGILIASLLPDTQTVAKRER